MADQLDALIAEFQNYVVSPLNAFGLGGFVFDVAGESIAHLSADITDHYTEDNRALQDHIAIKPKRITLKGYVGELVYYGDGTNGPTILQQAVQKLTVLSQFLPTLSSSATQIQESIETPTNSSVTLPDAANIYGLVQNLIGAAGSQKNQQRAYTYFKSLMNQGILMSVQTPWEFMSNMAIESITAIQPEGSIYITDFSITLKEIRIAKVVSSAYAPPSSGGDTSIPNLTPDPVIPVERLSLDDSMRFQGASAAQAAPEVPLGNVPGVPLPSPSLPGAQSFMIDASSLLQNPSLAKQFKYQAGPP
ncbi:MAG: hypothetical protein LAP61_05645 [Acidobacteriia bacterium]|nr:hypothetical protein [Terriglobia bacterium]